MTLNDVDPEVLTKVNKGLVELGQAIVKVLTPIVENLTELFNSLEPYQKFELTHPRKKPRGSLRRLRRLRKEQE